MLCAALCLVCVACTQPAPSLAPMSPVGLEDHFLSWQAVEGALFYSVRVTFDGNGYEVPVDGTTYSLDLFDEGTYHLQVRARLADGYTAYSDTVDYTLEADINTTPGTDEQVVLRGSGAYEDPILVYTADELAAIPLGMREVQLNGKTREVVNYIRLMDDIDLAGREWVSIGTTAAPFQGYFDGNGHTIAHLTQTQYNGSTSHFGGLFGNIKEAIIANLTLADVDIRLGVTTAGFNLGALVGDSTLSIVENCTVGGSIVVDSVQNNTQQANVGMLIGQSWGTDIHCCTTMGSVDVTFARIYAGGIVGLTHNTQNEYLRDCLSLVDVSTYGTGVEQTAAKAPHGTSFALGIGYISNCTEIRNCVWLGHATARTITGTESKYYGAGMFANAGKLTTSTKVCNLIFYDCYFSADSMEEIDREAYPTLAEVANRYLVAGAVAQASKTRAYCVDDTNRLSPQAYPTLDFGAEWRMGDNGPVLAESTSTWCTVTYMVEGEVYLVHHVLKGHTTDKPAYEAPDGYTFAWQYNNTAITEDTTIVGVLSEKPAAE